MTNYTRHQKYKRQKTLRKTLQQYCMHTAVIRIYIVCKTNLISHDDSGRVATPNPLGHGVVRRAQTGLVPKRPRDDARVVLISFHHALFHEFTCVVLRVHEKNSTKRTKKRGGGGVVREKKKKCGEMCLWCWLTIVFQRYIQQYHIIDKHTYIYI